MRHRGAVEREREIAERIAERRRGAKGSRMLYADMVCRRYLDACEQLHGESRGGVKSVTYDETNGWHTVHFASGKTKNAHAKDLMSAADMMYASAHEKELGGNED